MAGKRRYQLLCPVARALDIVGNRWALLILRDLHAGPARFRELQSGTGIATNLLATRLVELVDSGLVDKVTVDGSDHYRLTDLGLTTDRLLWELARFGMQVEPDEAPRRPGNLRTMLLPLRFLLGAVVGRTSLTARFVVDGEPFTIRTAPESASVEYGDRFTADEVPELEVHVDYEAFLGVGEGRVALATFQADHVRVVGDPSRAPDFFAMLTAGFDD